MIRHFVNVDKHAVNREKNTYTVRSIYFDTPDLLFYREKIEGVPYRIKLRIRGYNRAADDSPVFFEIKRKHMIPMTKNRAPLPYATVKDILEGRVDPTSVQGLKNERQMEDLKRFLFQLHIGSLAPTVLVVYDREPYEAKEDSTVRITFDKDLRSAPLPSIHDLYTDRLKSVLENHFILEVKYNRHYPEWMQSITNAFNIKQCSASKYCMSVENHPMILAQKPWQMFQRRPDTISYV